MERKGADKIALQHAARNWAVVHFGRRAEPPIPAQVTNSTPETPDHAQSGQRKPRQGESFEHYQQRVNE